LYWKQFAIISQTYENTVKAKNDQNSTFAILWVLHFIATIDKQQGLETIDNLMFTRTLFCTENSFAIISVWKHCYAKNDKSKKNSTFANSFIL
jgi:hypothetical protein